MTGQLVNIALWKVYLKQYEFDACVDYAAVVQILKAKTEPATNHILRLLDRLSPYSFNLYYVKGKDVILADYLSWHRLTDNDTSDLFPISFHSFHLYLHYHGLDTLNINTRAQVKAGQAVPKVHHVDKGLGPHLKPEHQSRSTTNIMPKLAQPKRNVHSIFRKLLSKSIKCLSKSAVGNTSTTPCTNTPHIQNQSLKHQHNLTISQDPHSQPFLYLSVTIVLTQSPLANTPPM